MRHKNYDTMHVPDAPANNFTIKSSAFQVKKYGRSDFFVK